jgi:hypothetical protein
VAVGKYGAGKYVATLIAVLLMAWTWNLAHSEREFGLDQRREIEMSLEEMITQYIQAQRPDVTDVIFQQLFSEDVHSSQPETKEMLVRFRYLTNEPTSSGEVTEQFFEGSVRLRSADGLSWEWIDEHVRSPLIRYRNGAEIRASGEDPAQ